VLRRDRQIVMRQIGLPAQPDELDLNQIDQIRTTANLKRWR
jgi:hypothetical protein